VTVEATPPAVIEETTGKEAPGCDDVIMGVVFDEKTRSPGFARCGVHPTLHDALGAVLVEYLLPSNYVVTTWGFPSWYVSSITAGGVDLNGHPYRCL